MIVSFRCKNTEQLFQKSPSKKLKLPRSLWQKAFDKLLLLHAATNIGDLRNPPSNNLEVLKGDRKGQYSIRINKQYRICFGFSKGQAYEVEITDYH